MAGTAFAKAPEGFSQRDRDDVTCLVIVSAMLAEMNADPDSSEEGKSGLGNVITYFLGKVVGRHSVDRIGEILRPDFVRTLPVDSVTETQRCAGEAAKMGQEFSKAGTVGAEAEAID